MKKATQIATAAVFALLLVGGMALHLLLPDQAVSRAERRKRFFVSPTFFGFPAYIWIKQMREAVGCAGMAGSGN